MKAFRFVFVLIGLVALGHFAEAAAGHAAPAANHAVVNFQPGLPPPPPRPPLPRIHFGHRRVYHHQVYRRHYRRYHRY